VSASTKSEVKLLRHGLLSLRSIGRWYRALREEKESKRPRSEYFFGHMTPDAKTRSSALHGAVLLSYFEKKYNPAEH
jgi:hypothetical protein